MSPCFLKKPAFCPSSEKEFSHVPASPPAMRNLSCATAAQFKSTRSTNAGIPSLRLSLIISRPPRHAAMQFDQLNRREFTQLWQQWRLFANNVRGLLCNHDNRRIDVASNQVRKHRRVDHAQAVNTD